MNGLFLFMLNELSTPTHHIIAMERLHVEQIASNHKRECETVMHTHVFVLE